MTLHTSDWLVIAIFFSLTLCVGLWFTHRSTTTTNEYFLSSRKMPWWLLGMSMVATTFSTDTPNLVTDIVRQNGVAGNWVWWAFLLTGMLTVFVYAKLWRRSGIHTDLGFYELRYGGQAASFLRGFRALYLGILFNTLAMAAVSLAAIKIGEVMLGFSPWQTIGVAATTTLLFSIVGGFRGVVITDFLLFFVAMAGSLLAAYYSLQHPAVGGLRSLVNHPSVAHKLQLLPDWSDTDTLIGILIIPLAVQWWSAWYPGAEPGGGGYVAQRMLAAKNERHAVAATFFFNVLHYALRPWPWILVALSSLIVFPDLNSLQTTFPHISPSKLGHDLAYPAMLTFLPHGVFGLLVASLAAAYMSTMSTHLNWGASYIVYDVWQRFVRPEATQSELVLVGRAAVLLLTATSVVLALYLQNAKQIFDFILMFGAGTGLIFILRWFWWRINAWSEIAAMLVSGWVSVAIQFGNVLPDAFPPVWRFPLVVLITTLAWICTMYLTPPENTSTLQRFYHTVRPGGWGWSAWLRQNSTTLTPGTESPSGSLASALLTITIGTLLVYAALFAVGAWLYGHHHKALFLTALAIGSALVLRTTWKNITSTFV